MQAALRDALCRSVLYTDGRLYCMVHLPARAIMAATGVLAEISTPFSAIIVDKDEVTLVLAEEDLADFASRLPGHSAQTGYRLLTFDTVLEPTLIGFLSVISAHLAEHGIPLMAFSAFERDHLLLPADRFDAAWQAITDLKTQAGSP
jgi:hypothetical protein